MNFLRGETELVKKHRILTRFALNLYGTNQDLNKVDKASERIFQEDQRKKDLLDSLNKMTPVQKQDALEIMKRETSYQNVINICNKPGNQVLCNAPVMQSVWQEKIRSHCMNRFRLGGNPGTIEEYNKSHKTNFSNYYDIYQQCSRVPAKEEDLVGHVFGIIGKPRSIKGKTKHYFQIAGLTKNGFIARDIATQTLPSGQILPIWNDLTDPKKAIIKFKKLNNKEMLQYSDYFHINNKANESWGPYRQGFKQWIIPTQYGNFKLISKNFFVV